jgi:hypothetical protein
VWRSRRSTSIRNTSAGGVAWGLPCGPRINLVLYHGVLVPHSSWRARVVGYGAPPAEAPVVASAASEADERARPPADATAG